MSRYVWTFVALLALTGLTLGLSFLGLGSVGSVLAVLIAAVKSVLIALYFMHLVEENTTIRVTVVVGVLLAATLLALTVADVRSRPDAGREEAPGVTARGPRSEAGRGPGRTGRPAVSSLLRAQSTARFQDGAQ